MENKYFYKESEHYNIDILKNMMLLDPNTSLHHGIALLLDEVAMLRTKVDIYEKLLEKNEII